MASRIEATRVSYLVVVGAVAITVSVLDFLPSLGIPFPPIGTYLTLIFMYVLSQSLHQRRVLDIYDLGGRLAVLLMMGMTLTGMFILLVHWSELSGQFFLNAAVAALVILILFDPLRNKVEEKIADFILRERWELERQIAVIRSDLWHLFDIDLIGRVLMDGLERTRRVTHAALYIISNDGQSFTRINHLGSGPPPQLEVASLRPLLELLERDGAVTRDALARMDDQREDEEEEDTDKLPGASDLLAEAMDEMHADLALPISSEEVALGLITLRDDRLTEEPYTYEDIQLLGTLATQVGVALGEMAAGLAHEIRNPLGAIKGAAQMLETTEELEDPKDPACDDEISDDLLDVIVEETDRLNRVVSTFLDYARPYKGNPEPLEINDILRRTIQIEEATKDHEVAIDLRLDGDLPPVKADAERLHQVFINLVRNAVQAMDRRGTLTISTHLSLGRQIHNERDRVEIRFVDQGAGITDAVLEKIFIPFFTTKEDGTGLGLPICQRIVQDMGGSIEVQSTLGEGTTFVVSLPAVTDQEIESGLTSTGPISARI